MAQGIHPKGGQWHPQPLTPKIILQPIRGMCTIRIIRNPTKSIREVMEGKDGVLASARKGQIIAIATEGDERIGHYARHVIYVPVCPTPLSPLDSAIRRGFCWPRCMPSSIPKHMKKTDAPVPRHFRSRASRGKP